MGMKHQFPSAHYTNYQVWSKTSGKWKLTRQKQNRGTRSQKYNYIIDGVKYETAGEATANLGVVYDQLLRNCRSKKVQWEEWNLEEK